MISDIGREELKDKVISSAMWVWFVADDVHSQEERTDALIHLYVATDDLRLDLTEEEMEKITDDIFGPRESKE